MCGYGISSKIWGKVLHSFRAALMKRLPISDRMTGLKVDLPQTVCEKVGRMLYESLRKFVTLNINEAILNFITSEIGNQCRLFGRVSVYDRNLVVLKTTRDKEFCTY